MHVPMGVSGVHAVPNTLHSQGLMTPLSTSPHWHAFGIGDPHARDAVVQLGVEGGELGPQLQRALRDEAEPAPLEVRPQLEHLGEHRQRARVALRRARRACTGSRPRSGPRGSARAACRWPGGCRAARSRRSPAACRTARARTGRAGSRRRSTRARAEEAVEAQVGRLEDGLDRRDDRDVVAEHAEVGDARARAPAAASARSTARWSRTRPRRTRPRGRASRPRCAARRAASRRSARRRRAPWPRAGCRCRRARASCRRTT